MTSIISSFSVAQIQALTTTQIASLSTTLTPTHSAAPRCRGY